MVSPGFYSEHHPNGHVFLAQSLGFDRECAGRVCVFEREAAAGAKPLRKRK
jgi:hypothetical protein